MKKFNNPFTQLNGRFSKTSVNFLILIGVVFTFSCHPEFPSQPEIKKAPGIIFKNPPDVFLKWNLQIQKAYTFPLNQGFPPPIISRLFSIYHVTMHDALNSVVPIYATYAPQQVDNAADANATMIQAVYEVLGVLGPANGPHKTSIDSLYQMTMASIKNGEKKDRGIALGKKVAANVLAKRSGDIPYLTLVGYNPTPASGMVPGVYKYLPPLNYALAGFHLQQPWVLASGNQFLVEPPHPLNTPGYTSDYNEVKSLGSLNSVDVLPDDRALGIFWAENTSRGWNAVARSVLEANQKYYDAWQIARLFALMHMGIADAYISVFDSKIHYNYWRPITAIREGDSDGNDDTQGDLSWMPALGTPPIAEYPSAHAQTGAAAGKILINFLGNDEINFTIDSGYYPGTRSFNSIYEAIHENSLSRIYIGYHFRKAVIIGEAAGLQIGDYVSWNALPIR